MFVVALLLTVSVSMIMIMSMRVAMTNAWSSTMIGIMVVATFLIEAVIAALCCLPIACHKRRVGRQTCSRQSQFHLNCLSNINMAFSTPPWRVWMVYSYVKYEIIWYNSGEEGTAKRAKIPMIIWSLSHSVRTSYTGTSTCSTVHVREKHKKAYNIVHSQQTDGWLVDCCCYCCCCRQFFIHSFEFRHIIII